MQESSAHALTFVPHASRPRVAGFWPNFNFDSTHDLWSSFHPDI